MGRQYLSLLGFRFALLAVLGVAAFLFLLPSEASATVFNESTIGDAVTGGGVTSPDEGSSGWVSNIVGWILWPFALLFRYVGILFLSIGGSLMTAAIEYSLTVPIDNIIGIQVGWVVMRDFANLFFIFIILFIAIQTILQLGSHNTKQMLVRVIVVALLINFSAFATKVIIDFGNVIAVGFYQRIIEPSAANPADCGGSCSIDEQVSNALGLNLLQSSSAFDNSSQLLETMVFFLTGIVLFVTGAVFFQAAFYFIVRTVAFCLLIVFSPIAFLAYVFPSSTVQRFTGIWWGKLWGYTLLAPAFMIVMYLVLQIITQGGLVAQGNDYASTLIAFLIVIGLVYVGTKQAFALADSTGSAVANWGSKVTKGAVIGGFAGGAAFGLRQTAGRLGANRAKNEKLDEAIARGGVRGKFAQFRKEQYEKAAKGSWDVAQSKAGGAGASALGADIPGFLKQGDGGFKKSGGIEHTLFNRGKITKSQEEEYIKKAKDLYPGDPRKQEEYLKNYMGTSKGESNYDTSKTKETKDYRAELNRKIREKDVEKELETNIEELDKQNQMLVEKRSQLTAATTANNAALITMLNADIAAIEQNMADRGKEIKMSARQVRPSAIAGFSEKILTSKGFAENVDRTVLSEIHKQHLEGKYQNQDILSQISTNVFASGNTKAQEYLASPEGKKSVLNYNVPISDVQRTRAYTSELRLKARIEGQLTDLRTRLSTETDPEKRYKLEDEIDKKNDRLEKVGDNIDMMES